AAPGEPALAEAGDGEARPLGGEGAGGRGAPGPARRAGLVVQRPERRAAAAAARPLRRPADGVRALRMTDGDALLQTIIDNPDDDAPRLVYADWIEEHGEPERAEFIRVQVAYDGADFAKERRGEWAGRMKELWKAYGPAWLAQLPKLPGVRWSTSFRRGFPHMVEFDGATAFTAGAAAVFAAG